MHLKQVDPAVVEPRPTTEGLAFGRPWPWAPMRAPRRGPGSRRSGLNARSARDMFVVVEQDMYPCDFDKPKPIAERTYTYLRSVGIGQPDGTGGEQP